MAGGNKDWVPVGVTEFDTFQKTFCAGVGTNNVAWHIASAKNTILQALHTTYDGFYAISSIKGSVSQDDYDNTDGARKDLKSYIRKITREEIKHNTVMTDNNRSDIGVPNAPASKTKAPVSLVGPGVSYKSIAPLVGRYDFLPKKKPVGQGGYVIKTGFYRPDDKGNVVIPTEAQCTQTDVISKPTDPIEYDASVLGSLFISYTRYLNTEKKKGKAATKYLGSI